MRAGGRRHNRPLALFVTAENNPPPGGVDHAGLTRVIFGHAACRCCSSWHTFFVVLCCLTVAQLLPDMELWTFSLLAPPVPANDPKPWRIVPQLGPRVALCRWLPRLGPAAEPSIHAPHAASQSPQQICGSLSSCLFGWPCAGLIVSPMKCLLQHITMHHRLTMFVTPHGFWQPILMTEHDHRARSCMVTVTFRLLVAGGRCASVA